MNRQRGFAVELILYAVAAAGVLAAVWGVVHWLEGKGYDKGVAEWKPKYDDVRGKYDAFTAAVADTAAKAQVEKAAQERAWVATLADTEKTAAARIARIAADKSLVDRSLQHYIDAARTHPASGGVPGVPGVAGAAGREPADDVVACRTALDGLARDCAVTTAYFVDCRDTWKGLNNKK